MLIAISILLGLDYIVTLCKGQVRALSAAALIIILWGLCFPLAVILLAITFIAMLIIMALK